jgi:O-methyltransferase
MTLYQRIARRLSLASLDQTSRAVLRDRLTYLSFDKVKRIERVERETRMLPGDVVEFGVALGGSEIILASRLAMGGRFLGFDVFAMIPPPTSDKDDPKSKARYETIVSGQSRGIGDNRYYGYCQDLLGDVRAAFARHGVPVDDRHIILIKGLFENTWPAAAPEHIALVDIDCDWYYPVKYCLATVADRLTPNGITVTDDYNDYCGCRIAVDEFIAARTDFSLELGSNPFLRKHGLPR